MNYADFLDHLLALPDAEAQRAWLDTQRDTLSLEHFAAFKARSDSLALEQPQRALEIAEVALVAAAVADVPLAGAVAHWARGNAWLCLSDYQRAFSDYEHACTTYIAQDGDAYGLEIARLQTNMIEALKNLGRYAEALALAETARTTLQPWPESRYMATLEMNVGSLNRLLGRYQMALEAYERGRALFAALDNPVQVARIDINRARLLGISDRFTEAAALLEQARDTLTALGKQLPAARAALNLATLYSRQGHHRQALATYREARERFAALGDQTDVAVTNLYMSYDYLALNLLPEALGAALEARTLLEAQHMPRYVALATANAAIAERKQGRCDQAFPALSEARAFFAEQGVAIEVAKLDLERVACLREQGKLAQALAIASDSAQVLSQEGLPLHAAEAKLALAGILLALEQVDQSAALCTEALEALRDFPTRSWQAYTGLGRVAEVRGQIPTAYQHYQKAIMSLETVEQSLGLTELQAGFLADKLDVYRRAIRVALALRAHDLAFELAERAKTGVWRTFLSAPEPPGEPLDDAEARETLAALRRQWHWLYQRLTRLELEDGPPENTLDRPRGSEETQDRWAALKTVEQQMMEIWRARRPSLGGLGAALPWPSRPSLSQVQDQIPEGMVLLDYVCMQETVTVFVLSREHVHIVADMAPLRTIKRELNHWRFNLQSVQLALLENRSSLSVGLAGEAHRVLRALYRWLMMPVAKYLEDADTLWIVPHDVLWEVPFAALHDGNHYLIEQFVPVGVPGLLLREPAAHALPASLNAAPVVAGYSDGGRLNYALHEAQTVAGVLGEATVLLEEAATAAQLQEAAAGCTLLHLATHGIFRQDAPLFSALHLSDGVLTANDLEGWRLPHVELVTLSACETGVSLPWGSDLLGLARGFWRAGAPRMVVSLWAVDDASTADLMAHFYNALRAGQPVAAALQAAQINALAKYRHPFYWAGFIPLELAL